MADQPARPDPARGEQRRDGQHELAGLATIAALTFLAARAVPGGFVVALVGGVPLARAGRREGPRAGFATALASLVETVAVMGPARLIVPLPHVLSAPLLGVLHARCAGWPVLAAAGATVRFVLYLASFGFYVFVLVGPDAYVGTYQEVRQVLGWLPAGAAGALWATVAFNAVWSAIGGLVQAWVVRRGLARWPASADSGPPATPSKAAAATSEGEQRDPLDGRAVIAAGVVAFAVVLATTDPAVLAVAGVWLASVWLLARSGLRPLWSGLALATPLALSTALFALVGGLGAAVALRRTLRVAVLVLVAVWLRAAASPAGLRTATIRLMDRLRRLPTVSLTGWVLGQSAGSADFAGPVTRLSRRLQASAKRPVRILDVTLRWIADEAGALRSDDGAPHAARWARAETLLVVSAVVLVVAAPTASVMAG